MNGDVLERRTWKVVDTKKAWVILEDQNGIRKAVRKKNLADYGIVDQNNAGN